MRLRVLTPSAVVAEVDVGSVTVPSVEGVLTAMPGHDTLLALLKPGDLHCEVAGGETGRLEFNIGPGLCEVIHDQVTVCVSHAEAAGPGLRQEGGQVERRTG